MRHGFSAPARPPRLALRFAVYAALTLAFAAAGFLWYAHRYATTEAERAVRFHATFVANTILRRALQPSDFQQPLAGSRLRTLDTLFRDEVLVGGAVRVKLYAADGRITYSNVHDLIGNNPAASDAEDALARGHVQDVTDLNHEGGPGPDFKVLETYVPVTLGGTTPVGVFELYQDYRPVAAATSTAFLPIAGGLAVALLALYAALFPILRRVTRRLRDHVEEIEHQALHDHLTGLPNRVLFRDRVEQAVLLAGRERRGFAVLLLDLDRFKEINDTLGHESGDRVLEQVAARLRAAMRESDTVARLGGDEFAVLAHHVAGPEEALAAAERVRAALAEPVTVAEILLDVDASVGVAVGPEQGGDVETLIRHADIAMYVAKELRTGAEIFSPDHDHFSPERLQLVAELRRAIAAEELVCHYQPQAAARSGELRGVEALVRWPHPSHGLLGPDQFIPLAERTGLIRALTRQVLRQAIKQCRAWHEQGIELAVSVNITGRDLLDLKLPDEVAELLSEAGLAPSFLELEITENTILADPVRARTILTRLSDLGVRLAIDDFGSGNSSLAYLKRLPVDVLKIDKAFVLNMQSDQDDAVIVSSTIALSHNLGLAVVAEGVETGAAWETLARLGCDVVQGYYLGRPVPAELLELKPEAAVPRAASF
ncbi:MAG: EAL domain-containing protein [Thermoleophilia bacterium]|nr:EAL domain-containing protein [Thermoleophilia bacterium]